MRYVLDHLPVTTWMPINLVYSAIVLSQCRCGYGLANDTNTGVGEVTSFKELVEEGIFVDKSLLIEDMLKRHEKVFQITRPKGWGKTVNLEMARRFFEIEFDENGNSLPDERKTNPKLFKGGKIQTQVGIRTLTPLEISKSENASSQLGKHPVIHLSFKDIKGVSAGEIDARLKIKIVKLFRSYPFLENYLDESNELLDYDEKPRLLNFLNGTFDDEFFGNCLEFLSMMLYEHFESYVCLFIDDYDVPIVNSILNIRGDEFRRILEMFKMFYHYTFKENQYLLKAVITGTLNFDLVPGGVGEFEYRYILRSSVLNTSFSQFYGITHEETIKLLQKATVPNDDLKFRKWFGGFVMNGVEIYNPSSVLKCIANKGRLDYYLMKSEESGLAKYFNRAFLQVNMVEDLHLLAEGKEVLISELHGTSSLRPAAIDFYSEFIHCGLLYHTPPTRLTETSTWRLRIPNLEVRGVFCNGIKEWTARELNISLSDFNAFINLLIREEIDQFGRSFQEILSRSGKINVTTGEKVYHNVMSGIFNSLAIGRIVDSIKEFEQNRGEGTIIPFEGYGDVAFNIEYNVCKPFQNIENIVKSSLEDLTCRPVTCSQKLRSHCHVKEILYVAIGFCGPKVTVRYNVVHI